MTVMDPTVRRNRDWFRLCDYFIESEDPWAGTYCKLRAGHDGAHSAHYPPSSLDTSPSTSVSSEDTGGAER